MLEIIQNAVADSLNLKREFFAVNGGRIAEVGRILCRTLEDGSKLLLFGNGGSAADAQHIAAEFAGRFARERRPLPAIALTTDSSILTAVANDYGFDQVFARQIRALARAGDLAIGISTSGNSRNVCEAAAAARELGVTTVGLTGCEGGTLGRSVDYHLHVPSQVTARVQEVHIMIGHLFCELVEKHMKGL